MSDAEKQITKLLCGDTGFLVQQWEVSGRGKHVIVGCVY